jgi:hypothetical protein
VVIFSVVRGCKRTFLSFCPFLLCRFWYRLWGLAGGISLSTKGLLLSPGFGWKLDIGKTDGFVFDICLSSDWILKLTNEPDIIDDGPDPYSYPRIYSPFFGIKLLLGYCF